MEKGVKEINALRVPTKEYYELEFKVEFIRKDDETKWLRMSAIADGSKILAWHEWEIEK